MISSTTARIALAATLAAATLAAPHDAQAQFLIEPAGGTVLSTVNDDDVAYGSRSLGFTASIFGQPATAVNVHVNGFLNTAAGQSIAPMAMDLYVYPGNSIVEKVVPGQFYSVTWKCGSFDWGHVFHHAQVVIFGAPMTLFGMNFQPNDIVFCYDYVGSSPWTASVELFYGPTSTHVPIPGGPANGVINDTQSSLLPIFGRSGKVIRFRPDGAGSYTRTVTPCPADHNNNGVTSVQDLFDFLADYFSGC
jgi:hypothetical protein